MTAIDVGALGQLLRIGELDASRLSALLDVAAALKRDPFALASALAGRSVACCFPPPATRARVSFEAAIHRLGALPVVLRPDELRLGGAGPIGDAVRAISCYCDALVVCTPAHADVVELATHSAAPVINAGTDEHDPCQTLADCLTLRERFGRLDGLEIAYVGDAGGVRHSLIDAAALTGLRLRLACPGGEPDPETVAAAGEAVCLYEDPEEACIGVHAVYADARVRPDLLRFAAHDAIVLQAGAGVIDPRSAAWRQAENLLPTAQALLYVLVTQDWEV